MTRTSNGAEAISYIRGVDGKGHNNADHRNEYLTGVNMLPDNVVPFEQQMQIYWNKADPRHTTQLDRFIISFAKTELDPSDPAQVLKGHLTACEIAREVFPDYQAVVATQIDGKGGLIHCHIGVNDVNMNTLKGMDSIKYAHFHFSKEIDRICQRCIDSAPMELAAEREPPSVRGTKLKNERIRMENAREIEKAQAEGRAPVLKPEEYIWRDDLKRRIREAATGAADEADFFSRLRSHGVEVEKKAATKKQPEHYTYELIDVSGFPGKIPPNLKAKSHKLGGNYQPEGVAKLFGTSAPDRKTGGQAPAPPAVEEQRSPAAVPEHMPPTPTRAAVSRNAESAPEDKSMENAKDMAKAYVFLMMRRAYDWPEQPKETDKGGQEWDDWGEVGRQLQQTDDAFEQFTSWRVERRKELAQEGRKLPGIYAKDTSTGFVSVLRDELEAQFTEFLDRQNHPEKYKTANGQPKQEQAAPVGKPWAAHPQQAGTENLSRQAGPNRRGGKSRRGGASSTPSCSA